MLLAGQDSQELRTQEAAWEASGRRQPPHRKEYATSSGRRSRPGNPSTKCYKIGGGEAHLVIIRHRRSIPERRRTADRGVVHSRSVCFCLCVRTVFSNVSTGTVQLCIHTHCTVLISIVIRIPVAACFSLVCGCPHRLTTRLVLYPPLLPAVAHSIPSGATRIPPFYPTPRRIASTVNSRPRVWNIRGIPEWD